MRITPARAALAVGATALLGVATFGLVTAGTASASDDSVLGPNGFGAIKVGMSVAQAKATGKVGAPVGGNDLCRGYNWAYSPGPVLIMSTKYGVYAVPGTAPGAHTPEGIKIGSTPDEVLAAYPDAVPGHHNTVDTYTVPTSNPANQYVFGVRDGHVVGMSVQSVDPHDCIAG
ncbi:hypothetical protein [Kutzneria kofuensis]|uniref:Peptidase inhibitor family I36 n=1 Tax=Kutzneria kofuensis TaxID=103725 RepID=A0A7W9KMJ9_9PSEU|nr:hypothetical protein [Kutzneria kofuensis]MBB5895240.1 hypothetical protein [Kutzneria kofuensis]